MGITIRKLPACLPECFLGSSLLLSGCEIIPSASSDGKSLTGAPAAGLDCLLDALGRHCLPSQDVEQLVREIKVPALRDLAAGDQHRFQLR